MLKFIFDLFRGKEEEPVITVAQYQLIANAASKFGQELDVDVYCHIGKGTGKKFWVLLDFELEELE
tara:strand:+ start:70 stop:267 length:198 start_codon:yes stop_codon:yes gene_type:complete